MPAHVFTHVLPRRPALALSVASAVGVVPAGCQCASVPVAGSPIRRGVNPVVCVSRLRTGRPRCGAARVSDTSYSDTRSVPGPSDRLIQRPRSWLQRTAATHVRCCRCAGMGRCTGSNRGTRSPVKHSPQS
ncbi:hypothetical protein [Streptomyces synnematoformans]|uniref:hypothetical protein n=1 Tax=Streptomyces synnematoformans TaxID=415721 RepID=UPI0031D9E0FE